MRLCGSASCTWAPLETCDDHPLMNGLNLMFLARLSLSRLSLSRQSCHTGQPLQCIHPSEGRFPSQICAQGLLASEICTGKVQASRPDLALHSLCLTLNRIHTRYSLLVPNSSNRSSGPAGFCLTCLTTCLVVASVVVNSHLPIEVLSHMHPQRLRHVFAMLGSAAQKDVQG